MTVLLLFYLLNCTRSFLWRPVVKLPNRGREDHGWDLYFIRIKNSFDSPELFRLERSWDRNHLASSHSRYRSRNHPRNRPSNRQSNRPRNCSRKRSRNRSRNQSRNRNLFQFHATTSPIQTGCQVQKCWRLLLLILSQIL